MKRRPCGRKINVGQKDGSLVETLLFTLWLLNTFSSSPHARTHSERHMIPTSRQSFLDQMGKASWPTWVRTKLQTNIPRASRLGNRQKNVSMALMAEMEAAGKGYAKEGMGKWGHGTRSSGQLSKPVHFHVKRREWCGLITSHVLRTWAELGTECSDSPLSTHFFCFV